MNGIRMVVLVFCSTTLPEYSPAAGALPESVKVIVAVWPAAIVTLDLSSASVALVGFAFGEAFIEQHDTEALSVIDPDEMFVRVICLAIGSEAEFRIPKETVDGSAVTFAADAAPASMRPAPIHSISTASPKSSTVVSWAVEFTSSDLI